MDRAKSPILFWLVIATVGGIVAFARWNSDTKDWVLTRYDGIPELDGSRNFPLHRTVDDENRFDADDVRIVGDSKFRFTLTMIGEACWLESIDLTGEGLLKKEMFNRLIGAVTSSDDSNDLIVRTIAIPATELRAFQRFLEEERFVEMKSQYLANVQCGTAVTLTLKTLTIAKSVHCSNHFPKKVLRIWKRLNALHGREIPANVSPKPSKSKL